MNERFDFIKDCFGHTTLIDKENKLPTLPFLVMFDDLTVGDMEMLNKWLDYLNKGDNDG